MTLSTPVAGLVIRYAYLWKREAEAGREGGVKDRPCAVLLATTDSDGDTMVLVLPITHSMPVDLDLAVEIPLGTKRRLGLDDARSCIILSEANRFFWPGPDLRPDRSGDPQSVALGLLPAKLYDLVRTKWLAAFDRRATAQVQRTSRFLFGRTASSRYRFPVRGSLVLHCARAICSAKPIIQGLQGA